jgi:hypothetical protein
MYEQILAIMPTESLPKTVTIPFISIPRIHAPIYALRSRTPNFLFMILPYATGRGYEILAWRGNAQCAPLLFLSGVEIIER